MYRNLVLYVPEMWSVTQSLWKQVAKEIICALVTGSDMRWTAASLLKISVVCLSVIIISMPSSLYQPNKLCSALFSNISILPEWDQISYND